MQPDTDVIEVEGIGAKRSERLAGIGVLTVMDLLRVSVIKLHKPMADTSSIQQVKGWRSMAMLMQVDGMSAQWAEALVNASINTTEKFSNQDLGELQQVFETALADGTIPDVPNDTELFSLMRDATRIACSGKLDVKLVNAAGTPIANTQCKLGFETGKSDARGRLLIMRIPLGKPSVLIVAIEGQSFTVEEPPIQADPESIAFSELQIDQICGDLDEYEGDELPVLGGYTFTSSVQDDIRDKDVLMIRREYNDGVHVQLQSIFRARVDGRILIRVYKVEKAVLPDVDVTDWGRVYRVAQGLLKEFDVTSQSYSTIRRRRRLEAQLGLWPTPPADEAEKRVLYQQLVSQL